MGYKTMSWALVALVVGLGIGACFTLDGQVAAVVIGASLGTAVGVTLGLMLGVTLRPEPREAPPDSRAPADVVRLRVAMGDAMAMGISAEEVRDHCGIGYGDAPSAEQMASRLEVALLDARQWRRHLQR